jgi:hypothetical protein
MKFRVRKTKEDMLYVQYKTFLFWKNVKKDGETIYVHNSGQAEILAKEFYVHIKEKKKKDTVLREFSIS